MQRFLARIIILCLLGITPAWAGEEPNRKKNTSAPSQQDLEVIALMDLLSMLDAVEDMEMIKDLEYLIEDDQNEQKQN